MTVPQNTVYSNGGSPVTGENANTFVQTCDTIASLRQFIAGSTNMTVTLLGAVAAGDGGGGIFQWQAGVIGTDDNLNIIVPSGGAGTWLRVPLDGIVPTTNVAGPGNSTVGHVAIWNNTTGSLLADPAGATATLLTNRSANYASSANYGGTSARAGLIEVLGSSGTPDASQDAVAIFQKWSNSTTNYNLGINPTVYVSNILKSGAATSRGTALYAEAQMDVNSASAANFIEGIRGHGTINAGIAGGEASGMVAFAGEGAGATHNYLIGIEAEVGVNSINASFNYGGGVSNSGHIDACFLATSRETKQPLAAFMINPFTPVGSAFQIGFFVPPASPNVASAPVIGAAFRSDAPCTWGIDLTGHGSGATFAALGGPNNVPTIRAQNAAASLYPALIMLDSSDRFIIGNDTDITGGIHIGGTGQPITFNDASMFVANGAVATVLGNVGPVGSHTTVQEWFAIKRPGGTVRYLALF